MADAVRKKMSDLLRMNAFTFAPGARWDVQCHIARFPQRWLEELVKEYRTKPGYKEGRSMPTRGLQEMLIGLDPAMIHAGWNLTNDRFLTAFDPPDLDLLTIAIASWATTEISSETTDVDWFTFFDPEELIFVPRTFNLLEYTVRANGTASPAPHVYDLLPTFVARQVTAKGLTLLGKRRSLILGPPLRNGRRDAVLWQPEKIEDARAGSGYVTGKLTFHVETVPNHAVPHIHADLSTSRFPMMPVTHVPARGDGPPGATVWLYAPDGFLRQHEPHTLLAAGVTYRGAKGQGRQWRWSPGLATALARTTHLPFPAPDKVFGRPSTAAEEGAIRAFILYSTGSKSQAADIDDFEPQGAEEVKKARSLLHAANTGYVPADHIEAHERLIEILSPLGIEPVPSLQRVGKKINRRVKPVEDRSKVYTLELWTQSDTTRSAVLAALEHHHQLTRSDDPADASLIHFAGSLNVTVILKDVGVLGAGIDRGPDDTRPESTLLGLHANAVARAIGEAPDQRAAIFELEDDKFFARAQRIDPKKALKKAFGRTGRRLQCLRPGKLFAPPTTWKEDSKKAPPTPYPGTPFTKGTIYRASAAINDALRQLGRLGAYETPKELPDLEQVGVWLHRDGNTCIPIVIRLRTDGTATAYLAAAHGTKTEPMDYSDLPRALAEAKGRIASGPKQKDIVAQFLINALGVGTDTHDRVVFVRAASFRNWGWDWLQDQHIRTDQLAVPGTEFTDDDSGLELLQPSDCPGLRIIRVRDRSTTMEVARGFAADHLTHVSRIHGLFAFTRRVYYSINQRSDQMQTPLGATKLDPDILSNFIRQVSNPVPLEISPFFLQPADDPDAYATLASHLRRTYLHTEQATKFPVVLHLCELADEYL
ncbi:DUF3962 domain-containing protein [Longispora sp. NPDC051575]|uniref:pPIWI_RE module domain-containing protein n=1 Tax=Longispora sp. NPDC051575 TaxID=3154943 RepID=UPI00343FABD6